MQHTPNPRLRLAAIRFLNPAPLMWDFDHPPLAATLATRYQIDEMMPAECAARLASGQADIGLVPIAALAAVPKLAILPGCAIAAKGPIRSLLLVRHARQPLTAIRAVAADSSSRATLAYTQILFRKWWTPPGSPPVQFLNHAPNLDVMLASADAAILIGDPALIALEKAEDRERRTGQTLLYHDLAEEWRALTGLPWISAVWATRPEVVTPQVIQDFLLSRDHGLANIDTLVAEWSRKLPLPATTIRAYLTQNIHYVLDEECLAGLAYFFRAAAEAGILPSYSPAFVE